MSTTIAAHRAVETNVAAAITEIDNGLATGETSSIPPATIKLLREVADVLGAMSDQELETALTDSYPTCTHGPRRVVYCKRSASGRGRIFEVEDSLGNWSDGAVVDDEGAEVRFFRLRS